MTLEELREYAKKVGMPVRAFNQVFAPLLSDENRVLDETEAIIAKAECDRNAEYWNGVQQILERNKKERENRKNP